MGSANTGYRIGPFTNAWTGGFAGLILAAMSLLYPRHGREMFWPEDELMILGWSVPEWLIGPAVFAGSWMVPFVVEWATFGIFASSWPPVWYLVPAGTLTVLITARLLLYAVIRSMTHAQHRPA